MTNYLAILMAAALLASPLFHTGSGQEARVEPLVFLNHFYLTLDHATYLAIENNQFLRREFAAVIQPIPEVFVVSRGAGLFARASFSMSRWS